MSGVRCLVSGVRCQVSHVQCQASDFFFDLGSVINGAYPFIFFFYFFFIGKFVPNGEVPLDSFHNC